MDFASTLTPVVLEKEGLLPLPQWLKAFASIWEGSWGKRQSFNLPPMSVPWRGALSPVLPVFLRSTHEADLQMCANSVCVWGSLLFYTDILAHTWPVWIPENLSRLLICAASLVTSLFHALSNVKQFLGLVCPWKGLSLSGMQLLWLLCDHCSLMDRRKLKIL